MADFKNLIMASIRDSKKPKKIKKSIMLSEPDKTLIEDSDASLIDNLDEENSDISYEGSSSTNGDEEEIGPSSSEDSTATSIKNENDSNASKNVKCDCGGHLCDDAINQVDEQSEDGGQGEDETTLAIQKRLSDVEYRLVDVAASAEKIESKMLTRIDSFDERINNETDELQGEVDDLNDRFDYMDQDFAVLKTAHDQLYQKVDRMVKEKDKTKASTTIESIKAEIKNLDKEVKEKRAELRAHLQKEMELLDAVESGTITTRPAESQGKAGPSKKIRRE